MENQIPKGQQATDPPLPSAPPADQGHRSDQQYHPGAQEVQGVAAVDGSASLAPCHGATLSGAGFPPGSSDQIASSPTAAALLAQEQVCAHPAADGGNCDGGRRAGRTPPPPPLAAAAAVLTLALDPCSSALGAGRGFSSLQEWQQMQQQRWRQGCTGGVCRCRTGISTALHRWWRCSSCNDGTAPGVIAGGVRSGVVLGRGQGPQGAVPTMQPLLGEGMVHVSSPPGAPAVPAPARVQPASGAMDAGNGGAGGGAAEPRAQVNHQPQSAHQPQGAPGAAGVQW
jgi:hypothetical protein